MSEKTITLNKLDYEKYNNVMTKRTESLSYTTTQQLLVKEGLNSVLWKAVQPKPDIDATEPITVITDDAIERQLDVLTDMHSDNPVVTEEIILATAVKIEINIHSRSELWRV